MKTSINKKLFTLSLLLVGGVAFANSPAQSAATTPSATPPASAVSQDTSIMDEIEAFSNRENLHATRDYPAVKRIVELLLIMDDRDPSRSGVMLLSHSYHQHKKMYDKAIREVSKNKSKEQKKQLQEIRTILRDYFEKGQG